MDSEYTLKREAISGNCGVLEKGKHPGGILVWDDKYEMLIRHVSGHTKEIYDYPSLKVGREIKVRDINLGIINMCILLKVWDQMIKWYE